MTHRRLDRTLIIMVLLAPLASSCDEAGSKRTAEDSVSQTGTTNPGVSDTTTASARPDYPVLAFENPVIDFGRMGDWEKRKATVTFRNAGSGSLTVNKVEPTCGCTSVGFDTSRTYGPDETGEIVLDFTPKGQGRQSKAVRVISNDPDERVRTITINADIIPALSATPRVLQLGRIPFRHQYTTGTTITALQPDIELDTITRSGDLAPHFSASIEPAGLDPQGRRTWRVEVVLDDRLPWGWFTGSMVVSGRIKSEDGEKPVKMNFALNGSAEGELAASDSMFRFMMVDAGDRTNRTVDLRRVDRQPFQVLGTRVTGRAAEGLAATASPLGSDGREWRIDLAGSVPSSSGVFKGEVLVQTDAPGQELIILRYSGVVRR